MKAPKKNKPAPIFEGTIAICGAAGKLGSHLVRKLHRTDSVVSIDTRNFDRRPKDVPHINTEIRNRVARNRFRSGKIKAVVYLGPNQPIGHSGRGRDFTKATENFSKLLEYCDRYRVKKLVFLSSADVYGARPLNSQFLTEEAPLLYSDLSALRNVDMMAQSFFWKRPDIETVILRPTHITGEVNSAFTKYLRLERVPTILGFDPMIQLIHQEDVLQGIHLAIRPGCRGIFNLAGPPPLPLKRILKRLNRKTVGVPHFLAKPTLAHLRNLGLMDLHPAYVDYIKFVCMVDDARAKKELGYCPTMNIDQTIEAIDLWR